MTATVSEVHPGCRALVGALDGVVASRATAEVTTRAVRDVLHELIEQGGIELPEELRRPAPDSYARRLVHSSPELGYTVLAMVWGPGQGTPLHDHAGVWCVEGVLDGRIEVTQYRLLERDGKRCRFERQGTTAAGIGSAGRLIPPFDFHTIANARPGAPSITIHVYGGEMDHCSIFEPRGGDWYEEVPRRLSLSS
jgi:predicted metal-dependent enzyme (double-stranded beta helix superfamily)